MRVDRRMNPGTWGWALLAWLTSLAAPAAVLVTDDSGKRLALPRSPTRIISMAPGATEMLFAAGAGQYVMATVEYSDEPAEAKRVLRIGDGIAVDMERVVALRPDVVVVWPGGGNPAQIAKLEALGLPLYRQQVNTLAELPASLRRLGILAATTPAAERAAKDIETRLAALARRYGGVPRRSVLLQVWNRPIYTVGGSQLMSDSLRACGARNVFEELREMGPAVDVEAVVARDPEIIVAVGPRGEPRKWLDEWHKFKSLRAVRTGRLIAFEDSRLPRLGPSAVAATEALCRALSP
jgi:iron complex transport system substrate-binding protein